MFFTFYSKDLLNLYEEFPLLCWQCLEDLKYCYMFYEKLKLATTQLKNLYQESLNQCLEEEHLIEIIEEKDLRETKEFAETQINIKQEEHYTSEEPSNTLNSNPIIACSNKITTSKNISVNKNDAFVITQFVASTIEATDRIPPLPNKDEDEDSPPSQQQQLLTVNLKAVEVKDFQNLDQFQTTSHLDASNTEPAVYICQYCPQAFAKSDYLKTHIHKSHVCKFCTQAFSITEELFQHIREVHNEHKCAICHKHLSSHTNLRHHIRRVHRIKLPEKVMLLDFIKSSQEEEIMEDNQRKFLKEEMEQGDVDGNIQYIWKNDDCIEMFTEVLDAELN